MRHVRELPGDGVRLHLLTVFILVPAAFNLHLLTRPVLVGEAVYYTKVRYKLSDATALAELLPELDWMDTPPEEPIRPHALRGIEAVDAHLSGVPFSHYLQIENYYQGYLQTQEPEALEALMPLLYPGWDGKRMHEAEHVLVLWWLVGLKTAYTQLFPDLFSRTAPTGNNQPDMRELMLAEIRALTGGDVTKNKAVLHADTMDALAELNAKAREAREMNEHLNKK